MSVEKVVGEVGLETLRNWANGRFSSKSDTSDSIKVATDPLLKNGGVIASSALTSSLLVSENEGKVYDLSSALIVDDGNKALFMEGFVGSYTKGTAVTVVQVTAPTYVAASGIAESGVTYYARTGIDPNYKYTVVSGIVAGEDSVDGLYTLTVAPVYKFFVLNGDTSSFLTSHQDISGKADKVVGATNGNIPKLDSNGNLVDSGKSFADLLTENDVVDNTSSTATNKPLSANQGRRMQRQIDIIDSNARFLSLWNCITGLPVSFPFDSPYAYKTGDRYTVSVCTSRIIDQTEEYDEEADYAVGEYTVVINTTTGKPVLYECNTAIVGGEAWNASHWDVVHDYVPNGSSFVSGVASSTIATEDIYSNDEFVFDATYWLHQINTGGKVDFANVAGKPTDNQELAAALDGVVKHSSDTPMPPVPTNSDLLNNHPDTFFASAGSLAQVEVSPAQNPHSVGALIVFNSVMYKVTAAIAVGDTLAVGINIANDSVANELSAKFDKSSVAQSIGVDTDKVPSSNAVKTALGDKFDKANIAQALGSDTDKVPSNKVVNDAISDIIASIGTTYTDSNSTYGVSAKAYVIGDIVLCNISKDRGTLIPNQSSINLLSNIPNPLSNTDYNVLYVNDSYQIREGLVLRINTQGKLVCIQGNHNEAVRSFSCTTFMWKWK